MKIEKLFKVVKRILETLAQSDLAILISYIPEGGADHSLQSVFSNH